MMTTPLSSKQCSALFDILTHADTYSQIQVLRAPGSLTNAGPPFTTESRPSPMPALQKLLHKYVCNAIGIRDAPPEFWNVHVKGILDAFQAANLSESYDKGSIGNRKTLTTAIGALLEYPARGVFGGIKKKGVGKREYDLTKAEDLERAWSDISSDVVWGTGVEHIFATLARSEDMEEWEPTQQAAAEYLTVHIASIVHYMLIVSPQGQYLLGLIEGQYKMVPWAITRQTLRIGNAATMISAMSRIALAKVSVGSLTNTIGITKGKDEGMNLIQRILSMTFGGDIKDFETKAKNIEKEKILSKEQLQCLTEYTLKSREEQEEIRKESQDFCISIVQSIFKSASLPMHVQPALHDAALAYLSHQLNIRDRREIVRVLCRSNPDHLTTLNKIQIEVMDPVIRRAHKAIDLSAAISDIEAFLKDLIQICKVGVSKGNEEPLAPTISDVVQLLRKHRPSLLKALHQMSKNDPEMNDLLLENSKENASHLRDDSTSSLNAGGAGKLTDPLNELFSSLPQGSREKMTSILDQYAEYLEKMNAITTKRLQSTLDDASRRSKNPVLEKILKRENDEWELVDDESPTRQDFVETFSEMTVGQKKVLAAHLEVGPGGYLAKWKDSMGRQKVTSKEMDGVQSRVLTEDGVQGPERPDTNMIEEALGIRFRELLGVRGVDW